jgi:monoamine oxidase
MVPTVSSLFLLWGSAIDAALGPLPSSTAAALRGALSAAQASFKLPYPPPHPAVSLSSALFHSNSPLFTGSASPNVSSDLNSTNPADPTLAQPTQPGHADKILEMAFARTLEGPLGLKLEQASLRWAGWETTTSFNGSDAIPEGGFQSLVEKVLAADGVEVKLSSEVKSIKDGSTSVIVTTESGESYTAKTVLCTIPLGVLKTLPPSFFEPSLPPFLKEVIKGTHVGVLEKLLMHYPTAWWPNAETVGSYVFLPTSTASLSDSSSIDEILASCTLTSSNSAGPAFPNGSATLLTYLSETPAKLLLRHDPAQVAEAFHRFLVSRLKPASEPPKPLESHLTTWLTDKYSYGATTTPSIISENGERSPMDFKELGRPIWGGKLGFAGEHTEMEHRGSVGGAVVSGQRESARIDRYLVKLAEA